MHSAKKALFWLFLLTFVLGTNSTVYAAIPTPKSEGKYFHGKGTRAAEDYEQAAGMPIYDYANNGFQVGHVFLRPGLDYRYRWEDNIFREESGQEKNDMVHSIYGDLRAELPLGGGQHLLSGNAGFFKELFNRFESQDHTDYHLGGALKLNFVPFTLDLDNLWEETETRADTEFTDRVNREENAFHSLLEVPFSQFFLENEMTNYSVDYGLASDRVFNHNLYTVYQRVGRDVSPSMQVLGELAYININYTKVDDRDGDGYQYAGGVRGNWSEFISYQAWLGAQHRIYDDPVRPDFNGLITRAAIQYEPSELSTWVLRGDILPQESTFDNQSYYNRYRTELLWKRQIHDRVYWNTRGSASYNNYSRITKRASTSEEETRRDWLGEAGTGLEYRFPNDITSIIVDYKYFVRESNMDGLDYEGNEVSLGVRAYW